jgi:1-acyl-sn-glycerol-3-phosphate acyltransferase
MDAITGLLAGIRGEEPPAERWDPTRQQQAKHGRFVEREQQKQQPGNGADAQ